MAGKKGKIKKIVSIFFALLAAAVVTMPNVLAFDAEENSKQQQQLQEENAKYKSDLEQTEMTLQEKQEYSKELQEKISSLTKKIQSSNKKIKELNVEIKEKQVLIDEKMEQIQDRLDVLRKRLRAIYTAGDISSLEIILQAKDFSDYVDKMELVQSISSYDDKLISALQKEMDSISDDQEKLKEDKQKVEKEKKSLEENKKKINTLSAENEAVIKELMSEKEETENHIAENEARQKELENALAKYNSTQDSQDKLQQRTLNRQQQQEIIDKANQDTLSRMNKNNDSNNTNSNSNSDKTNSNDNSNSKSNNNNNNTKTNNNSNTDTTENEDVLVISDGTSYVWPCPGHTYLTSTFEEWRGANNHGALDIADGSVYGAAVVACWNGTVIATNTTCTHDYGKSSSCGCGGGYGNYVMIDHGGGKVSIYGHLCEVVATPGQQVSAGQLIGYVGSTGYSTGPHLHFEMQLNGVRYDPLTEYN
ncbi:MAG: peptidoglycan DD-metalloendopeptidase family protein [Clostridia bacterium]|nr:peptidoglycan DD-metalloendopeptidase family protein [Clostridia bacterium]